MHRLQVTFTREVTVSNVADREDIERMAALALSQELHELFMENEDLLPEDVEISFLPPLDNDE